MARRVFKNVTSSQSIYTYGFVFIYSGTSINKVAGDQPNLFVKWRVRYIKNLDIMNLRGKDQNVRYIEVIVND